MFRRNRPRPLRRMPGGPFRPNGGLADEARAAFEEAQNLFDQGKYPAAAERFSHLAELAQNFNRPRRAVQLHLRSYDSWLRARQPANALQQARQAVEMVTNAGRLNVAARMTQQIIEDLQAAGYHSEARIFNEADARLTDQAEAAPHQKQLPNLCPQCGGRLPRAFGDDELECDYCGSIIRAE